MGETCKESTIYKYPWTPWFNFDPSLRNHYIEKPDMNFDRREDNIFMNDDQYIQIDYELDLYNVRYFMPTNFQINVNQSFVLILVFYISEALHFLLFEDNNKLAV